MADQPLRLFVYGSLMCGESHHYLCADSVGESGPAIARGQLYALPLGYPAMVTGPNNRVHGFVLSLTDAAVLTILDAYEQHDPDTFKRLAPGQSLEQNQYNRTQIAVYHPEGGLIGSAWAYVMSSLQVERLQGVVIPDGQWSRAKQRAAFSALHPEAHWDY